MTGVTEYKGEIVRDVDGMPLRFAEAIISDAEWRELQAALELSTKPRSGNRKDSALLLRVAFCTCGGPLYTQRVAQDDGRHRYDYYRCSAQIARQGCPARSIRADLLDPVAEKLFLTQVGHVEIEERRTVPGDNHAAELVDVGQAITELTSERYVRGIIRDDYDAMLARLQAEHARLGTLPAEPDRIELVPTGQTFADKWADSDTLERRQLMINAGFKIRIGRSRTNLVFGAELDPDLERRARLAAEGRPGRCA